MLIRGNGIISRRIFNLIFGLARRYLDRAAFVVLALFFLLSLHDPLFDPYYSPILLDRQGRLLGGLAAYDGQWRFPPAEKLNDKFAVALIQYEDRRFRYHPGIDPLALGRAFAQNIRAGRTISGASTITMQTIRLSRSALFRSKGIVRYRAVFDKIIEAVLAVRLELSYSKDKILLLYAANAPFGANVVGIEAASWHWFGRQADELSWAEAAALAVLPNSPGLIHPGRNRNELKIKRDALLDKLCKAGFFDEETLALAKAENLPQNPLPLPRAAPHLLVRLVREHGGLSAFKARNGASRFTTTLDQGVQERARLIMDRAGERFSANGIMNGACLIINTASGETAAYIGNVNTPVAGAVDIVTAGRSSGSLLKPFLYAAMLDSAGILPSSLVSDIPTRVGSYGPENITRTYLGAVPADEALARSLNIPAVRTLRQYGVDRFARLLRGLGLTTLFRPGAEYGLPLILGGAEVNLWEMTGLYAGLARTAELASAQNRFFAPVLFPDEKKKNASLSGGTISPGAAWLTLEALCFAIRPGEEAHWQEYANSRRIAWKTGTSFGNRDAWAIGVTPEWTIGVWVGNAAGEGRAELRSALTSAPVLFELFSALNSSSIRAGSWFLQPSSDLKELEVCAYSGYPPGPDCFSFKRMLIPLNAPPHDPCPFCRTITLNGKGDRQVILDGLSGGLVVQSRWFALPPAEEWYYRRWNLDYRPLPPFEGRAETGLPLALFNPEEGAKVLVPREIDGREGRIVFSAAHREASSPIYWHLDDEYLGSTRFFHEMEARPDGGPHTLTLVDEAGNILTRRFEALTHSE
jgi:penicillin-binding protein 1C